MRLAGAAARLSETTDFLHLRWHDLMSRAETFRLAGRDADADAAAHEAVRVAEAKGNVVGARLAREMLQKLRTLPAAPSSEISSRGDP